MGMPAGRVVSQAVDSEHRAERHGCGDPVTNDGKGTAPHEGCDVREDACLFGPPAGGMPRLDRNN
jgi:hypothetical protein